jgi:hypothetical protein
MIKFLFVKKSITPALILQLSNGCKENVFVLTICSEELRYWRHWYYLEPPFSFSMNTILNQSHHDNSPP